MDKLKELLNNTTQEIRQYIDTGGNKHEFEDDISQITIHVPEQEEMIKLISSGYPEAIEYMKIGKDSRVTFYTTPIQKNMSTNKFAMFMTDLSLFFLKGL